MKKLFIILSLAVFASNVSYAQGLKKEEILTIAEKNPEYVGGEKDMFEFIGQNLQYPIQAQKKNIQGKVFVKFVVRKDGSTSDMEILKGIGYGCDEETKRVIGLLKWIPAKEQGKPVNIYFTMPISFVLDNKKGK